MQELAGNFPTTPAVGTRRVRACQRHPHARAETQGGIMGHLWWGWWHLWCISGAVRMQSWRRSVLPEFLNKVAAHILKLI